MARFGYLTLRNGKWKDKQLLSEQWNKWAQTPTAPQPTYGFMNWFLNTDKKFLPSAPSSAFVHIGNGTNMIYVDQENDLVAVVRWIENKEMDGFVKRMLAAAGNHCTALCRTQIGQLKLADLNLAPGAWCYLNQSQRDLLAAA